MKELEEMNKGLIEGVQEGLFIVKCQCGKILNLNNLKYSLTKKGERRAKKLLRRISKEEQP